MGESKGKAKSKPLVYCGVDLRDLFGEVKPMFKVPVDIKPIRESFRSLRRTLRKTRFGKRIISKCKE